jgi:hypothetical protein
VKAGFQGAEGLLVGRISGPSFENNFPAQGRVAFGNERRAGVCRSFRGKNTGEINMPKWFHLSSWIVTADRGNGQEEIKRSSTYRRPLAKTLKGKKNLKAAKRRNVLAMKAAGHFRGDNRPWEAA